MCFKIYKLDPDHFLTTPGLAWQISKEKLDLLTDIDKLLMVEKAIRRGICHAIYWYAKANDRKNTWKNMNLHDLNIGMVIIW